MAPPIPLTLHGMQIHPDKTPVGCAAQDLVVGVPGTIAGAFWPMQQTQLGVTRYIDFPLSLASALWARGQLYQHTWSTMDLTAGKGWPLADVLGHKHDAFLHRQAKLIAAWRHPFFVRMDHEFNWKSSPHWTPNGADFVAQWRYIVDLFRSDGATNVTWVWCPNQLSPGEDIAAWYPGDSYADWTGVDCYNWPGGWQTLEQILATSYDALLKIAPSKPIFLAEWASDDRGGDKVAWLKASLGSMPARFPSVRAFTYYPCVTPDQHWALAAADGTAAAYVAGLRAGPYSVNGHFTMPPDLQPIQPLYAAAWGDAVAPYVAQAALHAEALASAQADTAAAEASLQAGRAAVRDVINFGAQP